MKKKLSICLGMLLITLLSACSANSSPTNSVDSIITTLTADFGGRLYGTDENASAAVYIADYLGALELTPLLGNDMIVDFSAELPIVQETSLTLLTTTGEEQLEEGVHYIPPICFSTSISGEIVLNKSTADSSVTASLVADGRTVLTFEVSESRVGGDTTRAEPLSVLNLTKNGMERIQQAEGSTLTFSCRATPSVVSLHNVMAVLPGKDREKAVVLGAHFDHMGQVGNTVFQGALDNASGVAAALTVASLLSEGQPETDIVFAFWNAEEVGRAGSETGSKLLAKQYENYSYLNVDCIGLKGGGPIQITTANKSDALCDRLSILFAEQSFNGVQVSADYMPSDHLSFAGCGSVNLGQSMDKISSVIHTPQDSTKNISYKEIADFSQALSTILMEHSSGIVEVGNQINRTNEIMWPDGNIRTMDSSERHRYCSELAKQLEFNEYMLLRTETGTTIIMSSAGTEFTSIEDSRAFYPELEIIENIGEYELQAIRTYRSLKQLPPSFEYNTVLHHTPSEVETANVTLIYSMEDSALKYTEHPCYGPHEATIGGYTESTAVPELKNVWLCNNAESAETPIYIYYECRGNTDIEIALGTSFTSLSGAYDLLLEPGHTADELLQFAKAFSAAQPVVTGADFPLK